MGQIDDEAQRLLAAAKRQQDLERRRRESREASERTLREQRSRDAVLERQKADAAVRTATDPLVARADIHSALHETRRLWGCGKVEDVVEYGIRRVRLVVRWRKEWQDWVGGGTDLIETYSEDFSQCVGFDVCRDYVTFKGAGCYWNPAEPDKREHVPANGERHIFRDVGDTPRLREFVSKSLARDFAYRKHFNDHVVILERPVSLWQRIFSPRR